MSREDVDRFASLLLAVWTYGENRVQVEQEVASSGAADEAWSEVSLRLSAVADRLDVDFDEAARRFEVRRRARLPPWEQD